ncbi:MAG: hypothetical protein RSA79_00905 [Oscillospiraceae bacterium]
MQQNEEKPTKSNISNFCNAPCCVNPSDIFTIAAAFSLLLYKEYNVCQLNTIINLLTLITANLTSFVDQIEINQGEEVQPPF